MPINVSTLRAASARRRPDEARSLQEAHALHLKTVFLCHSHRDSDFVTGLVTLLREAGWRIYVDWADASMPDRPNRETAARIKQRIVSTHYFLFLATSNSMASRWCPWEIGYADGKKPIDAILICPTTDGMTTHGSEYLDLYRRVDVSTALQLAVWQPGDTHNGILVSSL